MADTIGGIKKNYVYLGGAAAAGILIYAWYKNAGAETVDPTYEAAADEYESPLGNTGGNSTVTSPGNVDPDKIDTNAEWTQEAVSVLTSGGYESSAVFNALGKLLAFKALSSAEAQIAMSAKAAVGEPPVGGPYPIKDALPEPTVPKPEPTKPTVPPVPGTPSGLRQYANAQKTALYLDWNDSPNARGYDITWPGNNKTTLTSSYAINGLKPNTSYKIGVRARPDTGQSSPSYWAYITLRTAK